MAAAELSVITKAYDLILWFVPVISRLPRSHRFVLGERMERTLYEILEMLLRAKYARERRGLLEEANILLDILRFQTRLAKDLELLSVKRYEYVARHVDEIGREVGGWLKQQAGGGAR
jgi:hypothetical protein